MVNHTQVNSSNSHPINNVISYNDRRKSTKLLRISIISTIFAILTIVFSILASQNLLVIFNSGINTGIRNLFDFIGNMPAIISGATTGNLNIPNIPDVNALLTLITNNISGIISGSIFAILGIIFFIIFFIQWIIIVIKIFITRWDLKWARRWRLLFGFLSLLIIFSISGIIYASLIKLLSRKLNS
ncbi:hypothetical protein [[Mycoplasma] mobile]|uniref:Uncharacterized protein n=1 Tax=Mycoplasma mobile (strain ATCC 43663 / 163K / NCTC 11711) TaxID=267748 RepID=Q6KHD9_MYCM1|nr:hypothetical protein [[Mycoplasma] mobile]AAT27991.1 hypothetical protein MMOB5050 [Mycoplasma mobile 163K]